MPRRKLAESLPQLIFVIILAVFFILGVIKTVRHYGARNERHQHHRPPVAAAAPNSAGALSAPAVHFF